MDSVLAEFSSALELSVENTLGGEKDDIPVSLSFSKMKDFEPEQVAAQIPQLKAMLAIRNIPLDLRTNLRDKP